MLWKLYKKSTRVLLKATVATLANQPVERNKQRAVIRQISRVINCLKRAHSQHPAWLRQEYGTIDNYLEKHLSADDWRFVVELRQADMVQEELTQHCLPSLSSGPSALLSN